MKLLKELMDEGDVRVVVFWLVLVVLFFVLREIYAKVKKTNSSRSDKVEELDQRIIEHSTKIKYLQKQIDEEKEALIRLEKEVNKNKNIK